MCIYFPVLIAFFLRVRAESWVGRIRKGTEDPASECFPLNPRLPSAAITAGCASTSILQKPLFRTSMARGCDTKVSLLFLFCYVSCMSFMKHGVIVLSFQKIHFLLLLTYHCMINATSMLYGFLIKECSKPINSHTSSMKTIQKV